MTMWTLIPTSDDLMSGYTLFAFAVYTAVLLLVGRVACCRMDRQETDIASTTSSINEMQICIAVMAESLKNIEADGVETRTAMAEINRTLLDKLT